ncbi:MAG: metalloregulator ArsR/SmtB family transcription factor [Actinomycetota bacterium]|nr:metalloregulator ArsR/SmtB family transcription factor [Actinomycetota bacterium]
MEPADETYLPSAPPLVIGPCLALELSWAIRASAYPALQSAHPVLGRLYREHPDLGRSLAGFWSDGMEGAPELIVVASQAGALELESYPLIRWVVDDAWTRVASVESVSPGVSAEGDAVRARIADLAGSRTRRRIYYELLAAVWGGVEQWWAREGSKLSREASTAARREVEDGTTWPELLVRAASFAAERHALSGGAARSSTGEASATPSGETSGGAVTGALEAGALVTAASRVARARALPVVLAPGVLGGGRTCLELPKAVLVGFDASSGAAGLARRRALSGDELVRRVRAVGDATRLAILERLASGPSSVGELAVAFGVSQPTVSKHVKLLREGGLVHGARRRGRVELEIREGAVEELVAALVDAFGRPSAPRPAGRDR